MQQNKARRRARTLMPLIAALDVWYGKKLEWFGYPTVKKMKIQLLVSTEFTNVTDRQTDGQIPHDSIGRACIAQRGKNRNIAVVTTLMTKHRVCAVCNISLWKIKNTESYSNQLPKLPMADQLLLKEK